MGIGYRTAPTPRHVLSSQQLCGQPHMLLLYLSGCGLFDNVRKNVVKYPLAGR